MGFTDSEERQRIACDAMDAMEQLLDGQNEMVEPRKLSTLMSLVFDAARAAIPRASGLVCANESD